MHQRKLKNVALSVRDIAWAAGFLEGEGCFGDNHGSPVIAASQVQREPLERLIINFGGSLHHYSANHNQRKYSYGGAIWMWRICGSKAAGMMMTLFSLMSPKRRIKIRNILKRWKKQPGYGHNRRDNVCKKGHRYTRYLSGRKRCLPCGNIAYINKKGRKK